MTDGDISNVNTQLLNKLKATSAEEWKEERRKAYLAKKAGAVTSNSAAFMPKDFEAEEGKAGNAPTSNGNDKANLDFLKSIAGNLKRPREETVVTQDTATAITVAPIPAPAVSVADAPPSGTSLKAALLAKLKAKRLEEEAGALK